MSARTLTHSHVSLLSDMQKTRSARRRGLTATQSWYFGHGPESWAVGFLVPVDRRLLAESGEPFVWNLGHEVGRVAKG